MRLNIGLKIIAVLSVLIFLTYSFLRIPNLTYGFSCYYTYSKMLLEGDDLGKSFDTTYFNKKITEYGFQGIHDVQNNIPTNAFAYIPVAWMNPLPAKMTWGILSIVIYILSITFLMKSFEIKVTGNTGLFLIIVAFLWHPAYININLGQLYILLMFLFSLSVLGLKRKGTFSTGVPISLGMLVKGYGLISFLFFLVIKKYKEFLISILFVAVVVLLVLPIISIETWATYYKVILSTLGQNKTDSVVAYQTINGFFRHMLIKDTDLNPHSLLELSGRFVFTVVLFVDLLIISITLIKTYRTRNDRAMNLFSYAALIAVGVLTAPLAEEYHYVLFLPLVFALGNRLLIADKVRNDIVIKIFYLLALGLIIVPFNYKVLQDAAFPLILLAYPKLYGGILLILVYLMFRQEVSAKSVQSA